jgi:hypothetical protein
MQRAYTVLAKYDILVASTRWNTVCLIENREEWRLQRANELGIESFRILLLRGILTGNILQRTSPEVRGRQYSSILKEVQPLLKLDDRNRAGSWR